MNTTIGRNGRELQVKVDGKLDANTSEDFLLHVEAELHEIDTVVIDCSALEYISSAGLRALVALSDDLGDKDGAICLKGVGEQVAQVLRLTGMNELFPITE